MGCSRLIIVAFACVFGVATATELNPLSEEFIHLINSKQTSWKAGRNFPQNTPLKSIRRLVGVRPESNANKLPNVEHDADLIAKLPDSFDPRDKWPNCPSLNEIRDQGSCGSCWAFSAVEAMTDRICTFSNGAKNFHVSAEDLVSCCGFDCGDCQGGISVDAWEYWMKYGLVSGGNYNSSEGCRPYTFPSCITHDPDNYTDSNNDMELCSDHNNILTPKCLSKCQNGYGVSYKNDKHFGKRVYTIRGGEDHIKAELFLNGPVTSAFDVFSDFFNYKSGIYEYVTGHYVYGHAIKILGWGEENGTKYWLVANSWNTGWGDNGFFKILRGVNHLGIEDNNIVAGEPRLN